MQLDIVKFATGESLFRAPDEHTYVEGQQGIAEIVSIRAEVPHCLHAHSPPLVKNLCGRFATYLEGYLAHGPVSHRSKKSRFGRHNVMHHLHGTVEVYHGVPYFKGCCGHASLLELSRDLFIAASRAEVHMGVFKTYIGRHVQTCQGCFLEGAVSRRFKSVRVCRRILEKCQSVKLRIDAFDERELEHLSGSLVPSSVDLTLTHTGVLLLRCSWARLDWTREVESTVLRFCSWMAAQLRDCC